MLMVLEIRTVMQAHLVQFLAYCNDLVEYWHILKSGAKLAHCIVLQRL